MSDDGGVRSGGRLTGPRRGGEDAERRRELHDREEIERALIGIREIRGRCGRIAVDELLSARDKGRKG